MDADLESKGEPLASWSLYRHRRMRMRAALYGGNQFNLCFPWRGIIARSVLGHKYLMLEDAPAR